MISELFHTLLTTPSVSGNEVELQKKVIAHMTPFADAIQTDENGNVISIINPDSPCKVLLAGHIDEIGMIISNITSDGFLKVKKLGGINASSYAGHQVQIQTRNGIVYGSAFTTNSDKNAKVEVSDLLVDIGASSREDALNYIEIGDTICFDTNYHELKNNKITGRALDDKTGAYIVLETLKRAKERGCNVGVYSATTVGEESSERGAYWASSRVKPTMAVVVDVTYANDYPGTDNESEVKLGKGPVLCTAPTVSRKMNQILKACAVKLGMNVQMETESGFTSTDGDKIHFSNDGVPICLVSIPLRYMHRPNEVASLIDLENCIQLLTEFVCLLKEDVDLNPFH